MAPSPGLSPSARAATPGSPTDPATGLRLRLEEGLRQLHLCLYWINYRRQLTKLRDRDHDRRAEELANQIMKGVIGPFLERARWIPGLVHLVQRAKEEPATYNELIDQLNKPREDLIGRLIAAVDPDRTPSTDRLLPLLERCLLGTSHLSDQNPNRGCEVGPVDSATFWLHQGKALAGWLRLGPELNKFENKWQFDAEIDRYAAKLNKLVASLLEHRDPRLENHLSEIGGGLRVLATKMRSNLEQGGEIDPRWRFHCAEIFESMPEGWPPRALSEMSLILDAGGTGGDWLDAIREARSTGATDGRVVLAEWLLGCLDGLDQKRPLPELAWSQVEQGLSSMLGRECTLVRTQAVDSAGRESWRVEEPTRPSGKLPRLKQTGLVLDGSTVVRPAIIQVPRDVESILALPLDRLGAEASGELGGLARQLRGLLARSPTLEQGRMEPDDLVLVWRTLVRAAISPSPASGLLVDGLRRLGYVLAAAPAGPGQTPVDGWVAVLPDPLADCPTPLETEGVHGPGAVALRCPDKTHLFPAVWLRVPHPWAGRERWLDVLIKHEATLLRLADPATGWVRASGLGDLVRGLAAARSGGSPPDRQGADLAAEIFAVFHDRWRRVARPDAPPGDRERRQEAGMIARDLYQALEEPARRHLGLPLRPQDLAPDLEAMEQGVPGDDVVVEWEPSPGSKSRVEVAEVVLGGRGRPACLRLVAPKRCDDRVLAWARLPGPEGLLTGRLRPIRQRLLWMPRSDRPALEAPLAELASLLASDAALGELVAAGRLGDEAARAWLRRLLTDRVVAVYPAIDPESLDFLPPEAAAAPGLAWTYHDDIPAGSIVPDAPVNFSTDPARARATLSLGPRGRHPWLDAAIDLEGWLERRPPSRLAETLRGPAGRLAAEARSTIGARESAPKEVLQAPFEAVLSALIDGGAPDSPGAADEAMRHLARVADGLGLRLRPSGWSFAAPPAQGTVPVDEAVADPDAHPARFEAAGPPAGFLVLRRFGLGSTPGHYIVSAGPPPPHFDALRTALVAIGEPAAPLVVMAQSWPASAPAGRLELDAIQLFLRFWESLGGGFRREAYDSFRVAEEALTSLLEAGFGLTKFEPRMLQDYRDEWVEITSRGDLGTGRVRRVVRPGLRTRDNLLRVAALVEAE
ncbi:hypothetical protein [Tautonia plasticadhaerens]|uniref:Uncharacterized protein n=1 Tax=Tautonia plasticadhaerens TaxID=2527974 RepID=A0A518H635_9BACT|nr:hypothetical protein [Tautonia plasticadhaerens]QDV36299.1 hypothetical protein ElP_42190 [Tautonia plasticadhaerens]